MTTENNYRRRKVQHTGPSESARRHKSNQSGMPDTKSEAMPAMRKFISVKVTRKDGLTFINPLMMSEKHLLITMLNNSEKIEASIKEATAEEFKQILIEKMQCEILIT